MSHIPNIMDASTDLRRCVSANIHDESFEIFLLNAKKIIDDNLKTISPETKSLIFECIKNSEKNDLEENEKKEHLLMAASLLQIEYLSQLKNNSD
ncbi:MAG: hypothetical protein AAB546_03865 [Patescibacteria group bacterium]